MELWDEELESMRDQIRTEASALLERYSVWQRDHAAAPVLDIAAQRQALASINVVSADAHDRIIAGPSGPLRLRTSVPDVVNAVFLHIHGGGFTLGEPEMGDQLNSLLSKSLEIAVVSVEYRLAPEHPYPAGHDDCEAAAVWLVEHAHREFGADTLLIGGESAGAHLAAATLLRMRDRHNAIARFAGANLAFGIYDLVSGTPSQRGVGAGPDVLNAGGFEPTRSLFTPGMSDEGRRSADVAPLYADLSNLPPALFTTGTADHLFNDSLFMAARWRAAGNLTELLAYPGGPHGCTQLPSVSAHWTPRLLGFLRRCMARQ